MNTGDGIILAYPFDLEEFLGEVPKKYTYQWLRDGKIIPGITGRGHIITADTRVEVTPFVPAVPAVPATGDTPAIDAVPAVPATYKTVSVDSGHRFSVRIGYTLADGSTDSVETASTSRAVSKNVILVKRDQDQEQGVAYSWSVGLNSAMWLGFKTGNNPNGYILDETLVWTKGDQEFTGTIAPDEYEVHIEDADENYYPINKKLFELSSEEDVVKGQTITSRAPAGSYLEPNKRYLIGMREYIGMIPNTNRVGGWSCESTKKNTFNGEPGWDMHFGIAQNTDPNAGNHLDKNTEAACKFTVYGRIINTDATRVTSMTINTPENGFGFVTGDEVKITAMFSEPITGTLTMYIDIGGRDAWYTTEVVDSDSAVFFYTILSTDADADGITFKENKLHGFVDADFGHGDLFANAKNGVNLPRPLGRAVAGEELTIDGVEKLTSSLGESATYTFQWLRDGEDIAGATESTYMLAYDTIVADPVTYKEVVPATDPITYVEVDPPTDPPTYVENPITHSVVPGDSGHRISVRSTYTLADGTTGSSESSETSRVVANSLKFVGNMSVHANFIGGPQLLTTTWIGFSTGSNPNGYMLDRARVRFENSSVPENGYEVLLEGTFSNGAVKDDWKFRMYTEGAPQGGVISKFEAPPVVHLNPDTKYNISMRENSDGSWECTLTQSAALDVNRVQGWELVREVPGNTNYDAIKQAHTYNNLRCLASVFGRTINTDAPRLASPNGLLKDSDGVYQDSPLGLDITNTPSDGSGFAAGDTVQVTAKFTEPITATLTMPIEIGDRTATAAATGVNTDTFVFEYKILVTDVEEDGITFGENVLHGYVDADLGHNNLVANIENNVPVLTVLSTGPVGKSVVGSILTVGGLPELETLLGETPTEYAYQWLRDGSGIPGATGNTYRLVNADINHRIGNRIVFTLSDDSVGRAQTAETSFIIGRSSLFVANTSGHDNGRGFGYGHNAVTWIGFLTGRNRAGFMLNRALVKYHRHTDFEREIPVSEYEAFIELARERDGIPIADSNPVELLVERAIPRGGRGFFQAPPALHLHPRKWYNLALREYSDGAHSCVTHAVNIYNSSSQLGNGWRLRSNSEGNVDPDATAHQHTLRGSVCKTELHGRLVRFETPYLDSLDTNSPSHESGFGNTDTIMITAVFNDPVTGTISLSIDIGGRTVTATATGVDTTTFVFEYQILSTDVDGDGITFGENALEGWVDADIGHNDLWPQVRNSIATTPVMKGFEITSTPEDPVVGYTTGEEIDLTFTFDRAVEVTGTGVGMRAQFINALLNPSDCGTGTLAPGLHYSAAKSTLNTMVFTLLITDDIFTERMWIYNSGITLGHAGSVTDGWRPAGSRVNIDLGYTVGEDGGFVDPLFIVGDGGWLNVKIDSRTRCNN